MLRTSRQSLVFQASVKQKLTAIVAALWVFIASGCTLAPTLEDSSPEQAEQTEQTEQTDSTPSHSYSAGSLDEELLYELLVASIALQRGQPEVALDAISRAAARSGDRRLFAESIQLAMDLQEYEIAVELAQDLIEREPDNYIILLSLARAQFYLGDNPAAMSILTELAMNPPISSAAVFYDIANMVYEYANEPVLDDFLSNIEPWQDNANLNFTAALIALKASMPEEFSYYLDATLDLQPDWEEAAILKMTEAFRREDDTVTGFAQNHLEQYPGHDRFRLQYSRILIQQEKFDDALVQLDTLIDNNPESAEALFTIALIYTDKEMLDQASDAFRKHLALNPRNDQARIYLADIEIQQGNPGVAAMQLHGVSSEEYYLEAQIRLGRLIADRDGLEDGIRHLQGVDTLTGEQAVRIILEQDSLLRDHDQLARSRSTLDEGLELYPDHPDLLYYRGLLAAQMDLLALHEQDMRRLIEIDPDNAHAYNALGYTLADKTDRFDEAMDLITRANELLPDNPFILDSMGWIHFRMGNNEEALTFLRRALEVRPDAEIAAHLGEVLWITGNRSEAMKVWEMGTQLGPDNTVLKDTIERFAPQQSGRTNPAMLGKAGIDWFRIDQLVAESS